MSLKQFQFSITNTLTKESTQFIGDGHGIKEALADGMKNVDSMFRKEGPHNLRVLCTYPCCHVERTLSQFESDIPYDHSGTPTDPNPQKKVAPAAPYAEDLGFD